jgi:hypothetical protein
MTITSSQLQLVAPSFSQSSAGSGAGGRRPGAEKFSAGQATLHETAKGELHRVSQSVKQRRTPL